MRKTRSTPFTNSIYVVSQGKYHNKYEYGIKTSIVMTKKVGSSLGLISIKNECDFKTLEVVLEYAKQYRNKSIKEATCDRGYRGKKEINKPIISIPSKQ